MNDSADAERLNAHKTPSSGLTFVGLLLSALLAAVLLGQLTGTDSSRVASKAVGPTSAPVAVPDLASGLGLVGGLGLTSGPNLTNAPDLAGGPDLSTTPRRDEPLGYELLTQCPARVGGLVLSDPLQVPGWSLERWDCRAPSGPWSVVIRGTGGQFGVHSAVVTFPVDHPRGGLRVTRLPGAVWNPDFQLLVWPLGGSYAQIVGDVGQAELADLAMSIAVEGGKPHLSGLDGFVGDATIPYRSAVVHEMRYSTVDLGQVSKLGDGIVYTGVMSGASFETLVFEAHGEPAGLVRGRPAISSGAGSRNKALAWEPAPGEVAYIGLSGSVARATPLEVLRALADKGRALTPAQWQAKDRHPFAIHPKHNASHAMK